MDLPRFATIAILNQLLELALYWTRLSGSPSKANHLGLLYADDLNFELSEVQRKNRLLNRRVRRLERRDSNDDFEY